MEKQILEINGIKFEVDMSAAKLITEYRIGDRVNVLIKEYSERKVYPGIIVEFNNFPSQPTITVAYLKHGYSTMELIFVHFNEANKDIELAPCRTYDLTFKKADVLAQMDREIGKKLEEVEDLQRKKNYFLDNFAKHFEQEVQKAE